MSAYKQQCFFCTDTVSTGKLNQSYYKMHLENVHSIQINADKLLAWTLNQQNLSGKGGGGGSTLSSVASILGMKGITITKDTTSSSPASNGVPNSLINIKGITVQKVSDDIAVMGSPVTGSAPSPATRGRGGARGGVRPGGGAPGSQQNNMQNSIVARQQEQAIERWSNACEHGCRLCRKVGKNFTTFHRNTLLRHLQANHNTSERDYKEEFKCQNLITRASNMTCIECKQKVKRIPSSLSSHCKRHGMTIRQYWMKHVAPKGSALASYTNGSLRGSHQMRGGRGGMIRGVSTGRGGGGRGAHQFRGGTRPQFRPQQQIAAKMNGLQPKVMLNRVDNDTIAREEAGLGEDAMEVELDPLTLLEMGMGEDVIQIEGVAVKEEPMDSPASQDEEQPPMATVQITPEQLQQEFKQEPTDSRDLVTPEMYEEEGGAAAKEEESQGGASDPTHLSQDSENVAVGDVWTAGDPPQAEEPPPPADQEKAVEPHLPEKPQGGEDEEQKPATAAVNKHSIGSILSSSEHKEVESSSSKPEHPHTHQYSQPAQDVPSTSITSTAPLPATATPSPANSLLPTPNSAPPSAPSVTASKPASPSISASNLAPTSEAAPPVPVVVAKKTVPPPPSLPAVNSPHSAQPHAKQAEKLPPPVTTVPYTAPAFHQQQQPFQSFPVPPTAPPTFHPFQGSHPTYAPFPGGAGTPPGFGGTAYHPPPHGYPPTSYPLPNQPGQPYPPPVTQQQHGYPPPPQPGFVPNQPQQQQQFQQKTRWDTLSCPYSIVQCPLYCCHVRGMQELEEGRTDWSRPYGPPASGFGDRCTCCVNNT